LFASSEIRTARVASPSSAAAQRKVTRPNTPQDTSHLGLGEAIATLVADETAVISPPTRIWMPWVRTVIPDGVDLTRFVRHADVTRSEHPSILFVGTFAQRKRGRLLLQAFTDKIHRVMPDAELWAVAEDFPPAAPGVVRLGRLSDDALAERYRQAWVFCLPSSYEGLGIPYIEAMASGLPVVATSNPGARYVTSAGARKSRARSCCHQGVGRVGPSERLRRLVVVGDESDELVQKILA